MHQPEHVGVHCVHRPDPNQPAPPSPPVEEQVKPQDTPAPSGWATTAAGERPPPETPDSSELGELGQEEADPVRPWLGRRDVYPTVPREQAYARGHPKVRVVTDSLGYAVPAGFKDEQAPDQWPEELQPLCQKPRTDTGFVAINMSHQLIEFEANKKKQDPRVNDYMRTPSKLVGDNVLQVADGTKFTVKNDIENDCLTSKFTGRVQCLPSLVYIGTGHSGSTSLFHALAMHPQLQANDYQIAGKPGREPWFFNKYWAVEWSIERARHEYASLFPEGEAFTKGKKALFEKTPTYWKDLAIAARMKATVPNAKLVMLLRNPVTWLHSRFYPIQQNWAAEDAPPMQHGDLSEADKQFEEVLKVQGYQMCKQVPSSIKEFLMHYSRESLIVETTEAYGKDPVPLLRRIEKGLSLSPYSYETEKRLAQRHHVSRRPKISEKHRKLIQEACDTDVKATEQLLNMGLRAAWGEGWYGPKL